MPATQITDRTAKAWEIAERVATSEGLELVEVEWKGGSRKGTLRVFIDKPEGITHQDCELVSRQLSAILDVEDLFPEAYNLEVSSPGLDRKLLKLQDYERFAGRKIRAKVHDTVTGVKYLTGTLRGVEGDRISLEMENAETVELRFDDVDQARLVVEF